jgi:hypothetical protein
VKRICTTNACKSQSETASLNSPQQNTTQHPLQMSATQAFSLHFQSAIHCVFGSSLLCIAPIATFFGFLVPPTAGYLYTLWLAVVWLTAAWLVAPLIPRTVIGGLEGVTARYGEILLRKASVATKLTTHRTLLEVILIVARVHIWGTALLCLITTSAVLAGSHKLGCLMEWFLGPLPPRAMNFASWILRLTVSQRRRTSRSALPQAGSSTRNTSFVQQCSSEPTEAVPASPSAAPTITAPIQVPAVPPMPAPVLIPDCQICLLPFALRTVHGDHQCCSSCFQAHVAACMTAGRVRIPCPLCDGQPGDVRYLSIAEVCALTPDPDGSVERFLQLGEVRAAGEVLTQCPWPDCKAFIAIDANINTNINSNTRGARCPHCTQFICPICKRQHEAGHACNVVFTQEIDRAILAGQFCRCPCGEAIDRSGGCNHMKHYAPGCSLAVRLGLARTDFCFCCGCELESSGRHEKATGVLHLPNFFRPCVARAAPIPQPSNPAPLIPRAPSVPRPIASGNVMQAALTSQVPPVGAPMLAHVPVS